MAKSILNTTITRMDRLTLLKAREQGYFDLQFVKAMPPEHRSRCIDLLDASQSQLRQDIFALVATNFRRDGFFLEFGATDGVSLNNSVLLERDFGWSGILAEPARNWHAELKRNRSCAIDTRCVWKTTGDTLSFTEAPRGENSAISGYMSWKRRARGTSYDVTTVSLNDLLADHKAPALIDYASIDTEGSEFDILNALDWSRWSFKVLTVEHNFAPQREKIHVLLTSKGYRRVHEAVSRFDDWYLGPSV